MNSNMKDQIRAEVVLSLNKPGEEPQRVEFTSDKVSLLNFDDNIMVLSIAGEDGVSITVKFNKDAIPTR